MTDEYDDRPLMQLKRRFEAVDPEYIKFDRIENKRSSRRDIHGLILLNEIMPGKRGMISGADHDIIYLDANVDALEKIITDDQILELIQCGIHVSEEYDCLTMFV